MLMPYAWKFHRFEGQYWSTAAYLSVASTENDRFDLKNFQSDQAAKGFVNFINAEVRLYPCISRIETSSSVRCHVRRQSMTSFGVQCAVWKFYTPQELPLSVDYHQI